MRTYTPLLAAIALIFGFTLIDNSEPVSLTEEVGGAATAIETVITAQEAYFLEKGSYLQVLKNGKTPDGKIAKDELKIAVVGFEIHTYQMPSGEKGFFLFVDTPDGRAIIDHGNGGFSYTPPPTDTSTTTP